MPKPTVFFVNKEHRSNFMQLVVHFGVRGDREYMTACYVVALPEIARKVDWKACERPLDWRKWRGSRSVDLSNGYRLLVDMAANLFNPNNEFNLMDGLSTWDETRLRVFYQAMDIRLGKVAIDSAV